jgi:hypothetical protein
MTLSAIDFKQINTCNEKFPLEEADEVGYLTITGAFDRLFRLSLCFLPFDRILRHSGAETARPTS